MFIKVKTNLLHDGKRALSGKKKAASSKDFNLSSIKSASKLKKTTINDMITACLATGLK